MVNSIAKSLTKDELYNAYVIRNESTANLAERYQCGRHYIINKLKKFHIPLRGPTKYSCNHEYFCVPTAANCYWAGFIAGDGNIGYRNGHSDRLSIKINQKDSELLYVFKNAIEFTGPIYTYNRFDKRTTKYYKSSNLNISSERLTSDLSKNWNITNNKSGSLEAPNDLINGNLALSYIIGYFDANGSLVYRIKQSGAKRYEMSFVGWIGILEWISNTLSMYIEHKGNVYPKRIEKTYTLQYSHKHTIKILDRLLKIQTPYRLNRKWSKYEI